MGHTSDSLRRLQEPPFPRLETREKLGEGPSHLFVVLFARGVGTQRAALAVYDLNKILPTRSPLSHPWRP